jgi:hypothetical protein
LLVLDLDTFTIVRIRNPSKKLLFSALSFVDSNDFLLSPAVPVDYTLAGFDLGFRAIRAILFIRLTSKKKTREKLIRTILNNLV